MPLTRHWSDLLNRLEQRASTPAFCAYVVLTLCLYLLVDKCLMRVGHLPDASYAERFLALEVLKHVGIYACVAAAAGGALLARFGGLLAPWTALDNGPEIRWFIVFLAAFIAWPFTTYGYNFYFDQGHYPSRFLIALFVPLIWVRPVFIFPFLLLVYPIMHQFVTPLLGSSVLAHKLQVLHVIGLFAAAWLMYSVTRSRRMDAFVFLAACLVAGAYWVAFIAKMEIDWVHHGRLYHAPVAAYAHGWLGFLSPDEIVQMAESFVVFDWPLRIAVLVVQGGCLLFLLSRRVSAALLVGVTLLHLGVLVFFGFLFWTWMLLDLALLVLLVRDRQRQTIAIYSQPKFILSIVLIASSGIWAKPPTLGWLDTRLNYMYVLDAELVDGERVRLSPVYFAPYEDVFAMASFDFLSRKHNVLVHAYGVTRDSEIASLLYEPVDPQALFEIEDTYGTRRFNAEKSARFERFVKRYMTHKNARGETGTALYAMHSPRQILGWGGVRSLSGQQVRAVIVREITSYYDDKRLSVLRELEVARIEIPARGLGP